MNSPAQLRGALEMLRPFLALVFVTLLFCGADQMRNGDRATFASARSLRTVAAQTATVAVAALGMTMIVIAGGIDLSVGMSIALCATVMAWCLKEDVATRIVGQPPLSVVMTPLTAARSELERVSKRIEEVTEAVQKPSAENAAEIKTLYERQTQLTADIEKLSGPYRRAAIWTSFVVVLITIACGAMCGLVNGVLISTLRLVPFIVTLGTMQLYLGLAKIIASETTVRPDSGAQVPYWFGDLLSVRPQALWLGMPIGIWLALVLAGMLAAVLHYTVFGRYVFALGSNEATARLCGINVPWNKIAIYTLSGLFVGIAGLYQFSRLTVGNPTSGAGLELKVIASVVIGGGSLNGGRGTVLGTLTGALIMSVITSGCTALGLTNPIQDMILGIIIIVAVSVDQLRQRKVRG
ncbi:MAG: ABC transporter permease [Planctomycetes bacterium]|nr:ABC transporter permease [Planctomycetota bacterium]